MSDKPTYLGLLNAIAQAEWRGYEYLNAWAEQTSDPRVVDVLRWVAAREGEHAMSFAKRMRELGFDVRRDPVSDSDRERGEVAVSDLADVDKLERLGYGAPRDPGRPDLFDGVFSDHTIDPETGALLGRYIAEERDSDRRLRACCAVLRSEADATVPAG